jgi:hypothetical protein
VADFGLPSSIIVLGIPLPSVLKTFDANVPFVPKAVDDNDVRFMIDGDPFGVDERRKAEQPFDVLLDVLLVEGKHYDGSLKDERPQSPICLNERSLAGASPVTPPAMLCPMTWR